MVAILVPTIALPVLVYAAAQERRPGLTRLMALLLVFTGGMELLVVADGLLTLLIGWELVGACSWALIGHEWRDADNPHAGLYAFVTTRLRSKEHTSELQSLMRISYAVLCLRTKTHNISPHAQ